ncbi:ABC-type amino acid transport substrate-binding protein [Micromonospora pallida]|uniref:ABC-type amino acid transport substrate-binding protein n=1 Tax=Micromonospora pallida TaxID=145854 RepID=A0A1C6S6N9_9ACTN|nr:transporter substrate-binding domain-containing protein [Micromonospora pallida]SCL25136.1 ABC-type amino acid transport substrate-binding protein [Micromonospora pallida]
MRRSWRRTRTNGSPDPVGSRGLALFLCLAMAAATTLAFNLQSPPGATVADVLRRSSVHGRDLRVGVLSDLPFVAESTPEGQRSGFEVELAEYLARSLGVRAQFVTVAAEDRIRFLVNRDVDVLFAALAITSERRATIAFSGPYLESRVALLAWPDGPPDAAGVRYCVPAGSTVEAEFHRRQPPGKVHAAVDLRDCVAQLTARQVHAVAGDEILLRGFAHRSKGLLEIFPAPVELPVQRYGVGVPADDPHLKALVDSFLLASYHSREKPAAWQRVMARTLGMAGFQGTQPEPEGTLLREASDGTIGEPLPPSTPPATPSPSVRRRRSLAHRRSRRRPWARRVVPVSSRPPATDPDGPVDTAPTGAAASPGPWTLLLGVPVAVSALYLWIQSGGDRQITLMLAESVNPINFLAAVSLSVVWIFPAVPALVFTVGAVLLRSAATDAGRRRLSTRYTVARWTARVPGWVVGSSVAVAAISTPIVFLPAWGLVLFAIGPHTRAASRTGPRVAAALALACVALVVAGSAAGHGEEVLAVTAAWPAVMAFAGVHVPLRRAAVVPFVRAAAVLAAVLVVGVLYNVVTTPILPSTVIEVARPVPAADTPVADRTPSAPDPDAPAPATGPVRQLRGYVVSVDEESTTVLSDTGGVEIVPNDHVLSRTSCPSFTDLPGDSATLLGLPLRESMLRSLARRQRPATFEDPRCRMRPNPLTG